MTNKTYPYRAILLQQKEDKDPWGCNKQCHFYFNCNNPDGDKIEVKKFENKHSLNCYTDGCYYEIVND